MPLLLGSHCGEVLRRIVEAAVRAPSAENTQPWRFAETADSLLVYLDTARSLASDVGHMLSLTAIGAATENAVIAASAEDLQADVTLLRESIQPPSPFAMIPIARLDFQNGAVRDPLADHIETRVTARRMDPRRRVKRELLCQLESSCEKFAGVRVHWVEASKWRTFADLVGLGNRMRFEHQPFHREFYDSLRFTAAEAQRKGDGLDVATLQLPRGVAAILWLLRSWPRMQWANYCGFARGVARQAAQEVRRSGAVGFLTVKSPGLPQIIQAGRALERIWLTATNLGLRVHPTASLPVFLAHARTDCVHLQTCHARLTSSLQERFHKLFPEVAERVVTMAFRVGYGPAPPTRSLRRKIEYAFNPR